MTEAMETTTETHGALKFIDRKKESVDLDYLAGRFNEAATRFNRLNIDYLEAKRNISNLNGIQKAFDTLRITLSEIQSKLQAQAKLQQSIMTFTRIFTRDIEVRLETMTKLALEKKLYTEEELESRLDEVRGVRVKDTEIQSGDIVWVFAETDDGKFKVEEEFPVRVGTGTVPFDQDLIGRKPHSEFEITKEVTEDTFPELKGSTHTFKIKVGKVKEHINKEEAHGA